MTSFADNGPLTNLFCRKKASSWLSSMLHFSSTLHWKWNLVDPAEPVHEIELLQPNFDQDLKEFIRMHKLSGVKQVYFQCTTWSGMLQGLCRHKTTVKTVQSGQTLSSEGDSHTAKASSPGKGSEGLLAHGLCNHCQVSRQVILELLLI